MSVTEIETNMSGDNSDRDSQTGVMGLFVVSALVAYVPLSVSDWLDDIGSAVVSAVENSFVWIANTVSQAVFGIVGEVLIVGVDWVLFFDPPGTIPELQSLWADMMVIFWPLLVVVGSVFFLGQMLIPENEEADIYRFVERAFIAVVALIVTSPYAQVSVGGYESLDLFSATVAGVNVIGSTILPSSYSVIFLQDSMNSLFGGIAAAGGAVVGAVGLLVVVVKFSVAIVLVIATFFLVLAMRMVLVYVVYAMMPLLLGMWVGDIGPLKYGKMVVSLVIKVTALLLIIGIVISGILATTGAIAGQGGETEDGLMPIFDDDEYDDEPPKIFDDDGEIDESKLENGNGGEAGSATPATGPLRQIFAWLAGFVLTIAISTSGLGMLLSARGASGMRRRARQGRTPDARTGPEVYGGGGGTVVAGGQARGSQGTTVGENEVLHEKATGNVIVNPSDDDRGYIIDKEGGISEEPMSGPLTEPPEDTGLPEGQTPLTTKGKVVGENAAQIAQSSAENTVGAAKSIGGATKDRVQSSGKAVGDAIEQQTGWDVNSRAEKVEDAWKKAKDRGIDSLKTTQDATSELADGIDQRVSGINNRVRDQIGAGKEEIDERVPDEAQALGKSLGSKFGTAAVVSGSASKQMLKQPTIEDGVVESVRTVRSAISVDDSDAIDEEDGFELEDGVESDNLWSVDDFALATDGDKVGLENAVVRKHDNHTELEDIESGETMYLAGDTDHLEDGVAYKMDGVEVKKTKIGDNNYYIEGVVNEDTDIAIDRSLPGTNVELPEEFDTVKGAIENGKLQSLPTMSAVNIGQQINHSTSSSEYTDSGQALNLTNTVDQEQVTPRDSTVEEGMNRFATEESAYDHRGVETATDPNITGIDQKQVDVDPYDPDSQVPEGVDTYREAVEKLDIESRLGEDGISLRSQETPASTQTDATGSSEGSVLNLDEQASDEPDFEPEDTALDDGFEQVKEEYDDYQY